LRVVFDTNILVSALVFPGGRAEDALQRVVEERDELLVSMVKPTRRLRVLEDAPDNRILECAATAGADAIVTGDRALLALGEHAGTRILSLRDYLDAANP
jgi:predicted nucleic acid-binding protein